jgi:hypothetical protein
MVEPVLLVETGYSYEKAAVTDWFNKGNKFCPRSGALPLPPLLLLLLLLL